MSSKEFISNMKKMFVVSAISNFGAKVPDLASWTILVTVFLEATSISLCTVSPDVSQCLLASHLFILASWSRSLIPLYHGEH